jgi:hypothetical protein
MEKIMYDVFSDPMEELQMLEALDFDKWVDRFVDTYDYTPEDWEVDQFMHEKTQEFWQDQLFYDL